MSDLRIGTGLKLPLNAVTRTTAIVGQRGTGKTSTAVVLVEEAAKAGAQFGVIDPTGAWYGLRSSADGNGPGLEVVVFGGHHGDIPLEPEAGAFVARLIVDQGISVVLDLELMTKGKQVQFVAELAETLYHINRTALTLVIDEAHRFAPQQLRDPGGYGARCLGAVTDVVTLGRRKGLGSVLISQRPAKINKDVFEQAEIMIAHRLMGPNDRKAIAGWLDEAIGATDDVASLPALVPQHAIVWAPGYDIYGSFAIRDKRTFDSSATPEIGAKVAEPKGRADVDLAAIESAMSETIERAKADDPTALRQQIRRLESELKAARAIEPAELEVEVMPQFVVSRLIDLQGLARVLEKQANDVLAALDELRVDAEAAQVEDGRAPKARKSDSGPAHTGRAAPTERAPRSTAPPAAPAPSSSNGHMPPARQRILDTLAWFEGLGIPSPSRPALAPMAGSKPTSGGFKNNLGALRSSGLIDYPQANRVALTQEGRAVAVAPPVIGTAEELQAAVMRTLPPARAVILDALIDSYPDALAREDLAERVGVSPTSGGFKNNLGAMRTLELIDYPQQGLVAARPLLFLEDE